MSNAAEKYEAERQRLCIEYQGDGQGFYLADAKLRLQRGMPLSDDHEEAFKVAHNELIGSNLWREQMNSATVF